MFFKPIFTLLVIGVISHSNAACNCDRPSCQAPSLFGRPVCQACSNKIYPLANWTTAMVVQKSPHFTLLSLETPETINYRTQCFTFFPIGNGKYIMFAANTKKNSDPTTVFLIFIKDGHKGPGNFDLTGLQGLSVNSSFIAEGNFMTVPGNCTLVFSATDTLAQDCNDCTPLDPRVVLGPNTQEPQRCLNRARQFMASYTNGGTILTFSNNQGYAQCVADFKGVPVENADQICANINVLPISYPLMTISSVC